MNWRRVWWQIVGMPSIYLYGPREGGIVQRIASMLAAVEDK